MLMKTTCIYSLNSVRFVFVFDVEAALDNAKLSILERQELQIFCAPPPNGGERFVRKFSSGNFSGILQKLKCHLCF